MIRTLTVLGAMLAGTAALAQDSVPIQPMDVNAARAELGKRMFYDTRLSGDTTLACASCHSPEMAFTDGEALSQAYTGAGHFRNSPTLANVGYRDAWLHDGRLGTNLNDVAREMITETYLMNMDMRIMQERMKQDPKYVEMFAAAGMSEPSNGGARNALMDFMKTIVSRGAPIDSGEMSDAAKRGQLVFEDRANCASCHSGPRYTDDQPHNTGVGDNPDIWADPARHSAFVTYGKFMGVENYMALREDLGAYIRTHRDETKRSFLTPTLRELTYTAPYMHNGTIGTLEEVVEFYDAGGGDDSLKDARLQPLGLTRGEKADLVAFLKALSGETFDIDAYVWREDDFDYELIEDWRNAKN
ncbi:cytochrome-c peroxidase [Pelagimonas varians]|uniref:Cytochrome c551 peroxidase n=1 Tax=Pelagimonas varians TaxID=696760 RepID=A0A238K236_9RHOB|nr:cytochrome c peroxidase [Pelagimonas varians]PYG33375.1 cytochrome c peroxidase [Pelagimonas varians]SMX36517.1 Cytochrome c551 peroxidase precursor [Pelagimonas varians]